MQRMTDLAIRVSKGDFIVRSEYDPARLKTILKKRAEVLVASRKKRNRRTRMLYYALAMPPLVIIALILIRLLGR